MDLLCLILGVCCLIFNSTALHIVSICLGLLEFVLLIAVKVARKESVSDSYLSILLSILCLASGVVCLCV